MVHVSLEGTVLENVFVSVIHTSYSCGSQLLWPLLFNLLYDLVKLLISSLLPLNGEASGYIT